jgi:hypothetical protein
MQIQAGTTSIAGGGLPRPDSTRAAPRGTSRSAAGEAGAFFVPDGPRARAPEAAAAIAANFAEDAKPERALPRGSLVNLLV